MHLYELLSHVAFFDVCLIIVLSPMWICWLYSLLCSLLMVLGLWIYAQATHVLVVYIEIFVHWSLYWKQYALDWMCQIHLLSIRKRQIFYVMLLYMWYKSFMNEHSMSGQFLLDKIPFMLRSLTMKGWVHCMVVAVQLCWMIWYLSVPHLMLQP